MWALTHKIMKRKLNSDGYEGFVMKMKLKFPTIGPRKLFYNSHLLEGTTIEMCVYTHSEIHPTNGITYNWHHPLSFVWSQNIPTVWKYIFWSVEYIVNDWIPSHAYKVASVLKMIQFFFSLLSTALGRPRIEKYPDKFNSQTKFRVYPPSK